MPSTTNFNWTTPADTDLVKDGAAAIRTLGNGIDTSLVDLKGGTTGQVLSKNSNTDLDFTWIAVDPLTILDAKGDLISATAADTPARLAVGTNGQYLSADSTTSTGLKWVTPASAAPNKNYLINGGFAIAQRGTSFTAGNNNDDAYTLDRWYILSDSNDVIDVTQETNTVPTNGQFAIALDVETVNKKFGIATIIEQKDCLGLIGNTVTFSFKAKVSSTTKLDNVKAALVSWTGTADTVTSDIVSAWEIEGTNPTLIANATYENTPANLNLTTSYATYSVSAAIDTPNTKNIILFIWSDVTDTTLGDFLYVAEAKLEVGNSATAFSYAGETLAGELAACQRYYYLHCSGTNKFVGMGAYYSNTQLTTNITFKTTMRAEPTLVITTGSGYYNFYRNVGSDPFDSLTLGDVSTNGTHFYNNTNMSGTAGQAGYIVTENAAASIAMNAEL